MDDTFNTRLVHTTALRSLVGDVARFEEEFWERKVGLFRAASGLTSMVSESEMWEAAECGLLIRPYFTCFNDGVREPLDEIGVLRELHVQNFDRHTTTDGHVLGFVHRAHSADADDAQQTVPPVDDRSLCHGYEL